MYAAGEDDPEYVPEHMRMASESASDEEVYMTDEDDDDDESDEEELANHGRIFIPLMGAPMQLIQIDAMLLIHTRCGFIILRE